ncbi:MAG: M48 family metallopeptidase [Pseudomonadota bacterium]
MGSVLRQVFGVFVFLGAGLLLPAVASANGFVDVFKASAAATDVAEKAFYNDLAEIHKRLSAVSGLTLRLLVSEDDDVNAYATEHKGERLVVLNWGLLEALHEDRDAIAAVLAHEYAHHGKEHIAKSRSTDGVLGFLGAIAGAAIDYKLGTSHIGSSLGRTGAKVLSSSFSRDQEREADTQGLQWMIAAGYNPMGAVRMQKKLQELAGSGDTFSLFRTHPPSKDRVGDLQALIAGNDAAKPLLALPLVALNVPQNDEDDEEDETATPAANTNRTALAEPAAASLLPIQGFTLERYASFVNDLAAAEEAQHPKVYAKYQLTEARSRQLTDAWVQRMQQDPAVATRYGTVYLEASVGPFAQYGKDVAKAQRTGAPIVGDSPVAQADWLALMKLQNEVYGAGNDPKAAAEKFAAATRAKGFRPYDFQIASNWWFAVARQQSAAGNHSLLQKMASAQ